MDTAFLGIVESFLGEQAVSAGCKGDNRNEGWETEQDSINGYQGINIHVSSGWTIEPLFLSGTKCKDSESSQGRDQNNVLRVLETGCEADTLRNRRTLQTLRSNNRKGNC